MNLKRVHLIKDLIHTFFNNVERYHVTLSHKFCEMKPHQHQSPFTSVNQK